MGIDEKYKPIIEKHIKFFANKERTQRFYDLEIENFNEENIITGFSLTLSHPYRSLKSDPGHADRRQRETSSFPRWRNTVCWMISKVCEQHFGYTDVKPTLEKLVGYNTTTPPNM